MRSSYPIKTSATRTWVAVFVTICATLFLSGFETQKAKAQGISIGIGGRGGGILFDLTPRTRRHGPSRRHDASPAKESRARSGVTRKKSRKRKGRIYRANRGEKKRIQHALNVLGCDAGLVDGRYGRATRDAIKRFQLVLSHDDTGYLVAEEKSILFSQSDELQTLTKLLVDEKIELSTKFSPIMCGLDADQEPKLEMTKQDGADEEPAASGNATILPDAAPSEEERGIATSAESNSAAEAWNLVKNVENAAIVEAYVKLYGDSAYADLARAKLKRLRQEAKLN